MGIEPVIISWSTQPNEKMSALAPKADARTSGAA